MRAAFGCWLLLWIASHVTHGDDTALVVRSPPTQSPSPTPHLRPLEDANDTATRSGGGIFLLLPLLIILSFFSEKQVELRELRWERRRCRLFLPSDCICRQGQLMRTIRQNRKARICFKTTIKIYREIDITGKSFTISCARPQNDYRSKCKLVGSGRNRLFKGSPAIAVLQDIDMEKGSAKEGGIALLTGGLARFVACAMLQSRATGHGGALRITGGAVEIYSDFRNNSASGDGGAISASGSSTSVTLSSEMYFNTATNGGAVSVVDGAQLRVTGNYFGNIAKVNGGAFYLRNSSVIMRVGAITNSAGSRGGSVYVKNARLTLEEGTTLFDPASKTRSNNLWVDDDDDPSDRGSFVRCFGPESAQDFEEIATGPDQTQKFRNTNCTQSTPRPTIAPAIPALWPFPTPAVKAPVNAPLPINATR
jgi:predicted outer membrane repeat protein